jgi:serine/threonine-protein phosphatase with EF-hand domain
MRRLTAWHIYQSIEYSGEQNQLKLYDFFLALIRNMSVISNDNKRIDVEKIQNELVSDINPSAEEATPAANKSFLDKLALLAKNEDSKKFKSIRTIHKIFQTSSSENLKDSKKNKQEITVEPSYKGVEIKMPVTKQIFHDLINSYKENKSLHVKYVILILEETLKLLKTLKNINMISTSTNQNITIVGDLHGSLDDLLLILYKVNSLFHLIFKKALNNF